jgi:VWFA-related protein
MDSRIPVQPQEVRVEWIAGMLSRREWLISSAALLTGGRLPGQQPEAKYTAQVNVVNVFVTVRNKQGQIVRDLTKDDFTLQEDGIPRVIGYFSAQSDLPLTLGLLVDTSASQRRLLVTERDASHIFLGRVLREDKDFAFVIHFDREVELLQDLTASRQLLQKATDSLGASEPGRSNQRGGGRRGMGGTTLYDAVLLASDELMRKQQGRKAVILLSDGVDNGSKVPVASAIEAAQRADTLVYSIRFYDQQIYQRESMGRGGMGGPVGRRGGMGRGSPLPGSRSGAPSAADGKKILQRISLETGATYFEPSKKQPIDKIYSLIEEELRNQYSLGYTPDKTGTGEYRKIKVAVKGKGLVVQAREGYYAR